MTAGPTPSFSSALDLAAVLVLAETGVDAFRGASPEAGRNRIFGGLVVAQALVAMGRTVRKRPVHSLHGYFLLPGDPAGSIDYAVERMRDGGSFSTRRCVATQQDRVIFAVSGSFHAAEPEGFDHATAMPAVPAPEDLPSRAEILADKGPELPEPLRRYLGRDAPIELRPTDLASRLSAEDRECRSSQSIWMRASGSLPDDGLLHAAVLAYMSDMTLLDTALVPHRRTVFDPGIQAASLDHSIWFHRPFRADEWLLYVEDSPSASGNRGFARGSIFDRTGRLVASTAQEGLLRHKRLSTASLIA